MKMYTDPRVETLDARQLLEALGPAHCGYGPTGGPDLMPLPGGSGKPNGNIVIRGRG
ncbi:MAG: hypothetical protein MUF27_05020 [Acidobacteria bacterium]|nr:hypothetical protein [Acidobacteriota bacterium]